MGTLNIEQMYMYICIYAHTQEIYYILYNVFLFFCIQIELRITKEYSSTSFI
jgi:hypothetical protein